MPIEQTTHVREVLIVKPSPTAPWSAHQKRITITTGAGVPIPEIYGDAEPLDLADVADVLSPAFVDMTNERNAAVEAKLAADQARAQAEEERDAAAVDAAASKAQMEAQAAQLASAQVNIATLNSLVEALQEQLLQMKQERDTLEGRLITAEWARSELEAPPQA
ncbi:hypothetical protein [Rhizorhabdus sp.]|uniref:hypothetical protein n=1 Tax=Rhizorhabdus sp. TaxID=1968843 RepID=UPI0035B0E53C